MKEAGTEIENESSHVNSLTKGSGIVIIERIGTTETGIGIGTETETGKETETEIVDVTEIEHVIGIMTVSARGIVIAIGNMIDIVKGIEIMKLVIRIGDGHAIGRLIMTVLTLNTRGTDMVKGSVTMSLRMIVVGITNLSMDIGMQTLIMILTSMSIIVDEGSMIM